MSETTRSRESWLRSFGRLASACLLWALCACESAAPGTGAGGGNSVVGTTGAPPAASAGTGTGGVEAGATTGVGAGGPAGGPGTMTGGATTGGAMTGGTTGGLGDTGPDGVGSGDAGLPGSDAGLIDSGSPSGLAPSVRNPAYASVAPALGEPLPAAPPGTWSYLDVDGAVSRDGSPAGLYYKYSSTGSRNLMIYLPGGGACQDTFFCNMNPPNKSFSLSAESVLSGVANLLGPTAEPQDPRGGRFNSGILKDDPENPVKDWNMVFIPYVTGDVFAGTKTNATVPNVAGTHQFVGHSNMQKFLSRVVATFDDASTVLFTGSSAGGLGALLNAPFLIDAYVDLGRGARVFVVNDAGPFFDDPYLEVCLQQRYRDLFGLNDSFPPDCQGCAGQGGGITKAYIAYLVDKYPDVLLGGLVDSTQDEIMKLFFSEGLDNCAYVDDPLTGFLLAYPANRYRQGLENLLNVHMQRMSSYIWTGSLHQNFFRTDAGDRFYQRNGLSKTPAEWLSGLLTGELERLGL